MRRILNGKVYDTDEAELLVSWDNGRRDSDCRRAEEHLYRLGDFGRFFIVRRGGSRSKYAVKAGQNGKHRSAAMRACDFGEVQEWIKKRKIMLNDDLITKMGREAFVHSMVLSISAPDDNRAMQVANLAECFSYGLSVAEIERAKAEALERLGVVEQSSGMNVKEAFVQCLMLARTAPDESRFMAAVELAEDFARDFTVAEIELAKAEALERLELMEEGQS